VECIDHKARGAVGQVMNEVAFFEAGGDASRMKAWVIGGMAAAALMFSSGEGVAQVKGARSYFPKNYQPPPANGAAAGGAPAQPGGGQAGATNKQQPAAKPPPPKFKDLPVSSQFYFLSDTNHSFAWMKISTTTASNTVNGVARPINGETPIQK